MHDYVGSGTDRRCADPAVEKLVSDRLLPDSFGGLLLLALNLQNLVYPMSEYVQDDPAWKVNHDPLLRRSTTSVTPGRGYEVTIVCQLQDSRVSEGECQIASILR